jgi:hypothetical protein
MDESNAYTASAIGAGPEASSASGHAVAEARLEDSGSGLAPASDGWFVVNVRDAQWLTSENGEKQPSGSECAFESAKCEFSQLGIRLHVLPPVSQTASTTARTS